MFCSTSLVTRERQMETTMRYHLTSVRMAIIKKSTKDTGYRRCGEKGTFLHGKKKKKKKKESEVAHFLKASGSLRPRGL